MTRFILVHGAIAGGALALIMIVTAFATRGGTDFTLFEWMGYLSMIVALSVIFVAIKRHRDRDLGGVIKFRRGLLVGVGVVLVASVFYVIGWEISLALTDYAFIDDYARSAIETREAAGATPEELEALRAQMEQMTALYRNPVLRMAMSFMEIFPVGLLISIVSALALRFPGVLPARHASA